MGSDGIPLNLFESSSSSPAGAAASNNAAAATVSTGYGNTHRLSNDTDETVNLESATPQSQPEASTQAVLTEIRDFLSILTSREKTAGPRSPTEPDTRPVRSGVAQPDPPSGIQNKPPPQLPKFGDLADYWKYFDEAAKEESDGMIKGMKDNLDNLLIFAALFSAINSGFIALSLPMLSDDPSAETNTLLRLLVQRADNSTLTPADLVPPPFGPSRTGIAINQLFSISLTLSLLASFGALLAQQWIVHYVRPTWAALDGGRWDRERKYRGAQRWKLQEVVEILLPILLQAALFVFIIGFIVFLHSLSHPVALPNFTLAIIGAFFFVISTILAAWDPFCPFHTPFTTIIRVTVRPCFKVLSLILRMFLVCFVFPVLWILQRWPDASDWRGDLLNRTADGIGELVERVAVQQEAIEVVQGQAVGRFLRDNGHVQLLKATAINLPLYSLERQDVQGLSYFQASSWRLLDLFELASRGGNQEEKGVYAKALVHQALMQPKDSSSILPKDAYISAAQAYMNVPGETFSYTTSAVATVLMCYLAHLPDDSTEKAQECFDLVCQSAIQMPPLPIIGGLLSLVNVLHSSVKAPYPSGIQRRVIEEYMNISMIKHYIEGGQTEDAIVHISRSVQRVIQRNTRNLDIQLLRLAFSMYEPRDEVSHRVMMSLMVWASAATEAMGWEGLVLMTGAVIDGLEVLFVAPTMDDGVPEGTYIRRDEAEGAAVDLLSRMFSRGGCRLLSLESSSQIPQSLPFWTTYAETVRRRHDRSQSHSVEQLFSTLVQRLHDRPDLHNTEGGIKFRRTVASLSEDVVKLNEGLKDWVMEALDVKLEDEVAEKGGVALPEEKLPIDA